MKTIVLMTVLMLGMSTSMFAQTNLNTKTFSFNKDSVSLLPKPRPNLFRRIVNSLTASNKETLRKAEEIMNQLPFRFKFDSEQFVKNIRQSARYDITNQRPMNGLLHLDLYE